MGSHGHPTSATDAVSTALEGRTAIVAGAGPGVGRACAAAFREAGANVVVAARDAERLATMAAELSAEPGIGQVIPMVLDLGDLGSCAKLVDQVLERLGRIDILVNVATTGGDQTTIDEVEPDWASWQRAFEVNVIGTLELSRLAARAMSRTSDGAGSAEGGSIIQSAEGGSIIQIGTVGTHALPARRARYTATKQAMVSASLTLAKELGPTGIRVNVVTPGFITGAPLDAMVSSIAARTGESADDVSRHMAAGAALRRHVDPGDVAAAVLFLAGPGARNVTGVELPVTAGR
jgi:NAD(P)-dependent dehydrogenase (short-subunit alcohol dehydrogenase family)